MTDANTPSRFGVIMAGGAGERFWPLSRQNRPKQLLPLAHPEKSLLQEAVERLAPVIPSERIYIITGKHLVDAIRQANVGVPGENVLAEPCKRNTSGALAYAAAWLMARNPDCPPEAISMAITTADHYIGAPAKFEHAVTTALRAAEENNALATCGIVPTRPETGFGYIQAPDSLETLPGFSQGIPVYPVLAFHEKPDADTARQYLASGCYFWNSGMFFWTIGAFLTELDRAMPPLAQATRKMAECLKANDHDAAATIFERLENISIDYALMERASNAVVVRGDFPWEDIGSWTALHFETGADARGNCLAGDPVIYDSEGCIVYNALGAERMAVGVVGAHDLVVVATEDGILVVPKHRVQDVREIVTFLKERGATQL